MKILVNNDNYYKKILSKELNIDNKEFKEIILEEIFKNFIHTK